MQQLGCCTEAGKLQKKTQYYSKYFSVVDCRMRKKFKTEA
jgi:hypothetical protein